MADAITVRITQVRGSTPRGVGTAMQVMREGQNGTIGGGALEWAATHIAREMLTSGAQSKSCVMPLGPDLGQCCGGVVTLEFTAGIPVDPPSRAPLWIWGAGHVGRAIAAVMAPFEDRDITLIDTSAARMPRTLPARVSPLVAADPLRIVPRAPSDADHLIVTYSHELDLALCDALLRRGFGSCGLIGSATKWARFRNRLKKMGHQDAEISGIACPIGNPALGKHPQAIAMGVGLTLLSSAGQLAPATSMGETAE